MSIETDAAMWQKRCQKYGWHDVVRYPNDHPRGVELVECKTGDGFEERCFGRYSNVFRMWVDTKGLPIGVKKWRRIAE